MSQSLTENSNRDTHPSPNYGEIAPTSEVFFVPQEIRGHSINAVQMSVRLKHVLERLRITLLGDLHGRTVSEFVKFRNCGRKTADELFELVRVLQSGAVQPGRSGQTEAGLVPVYEPVRDEAFVVAENARQIAFSDLPLSVRLTRVLDRLGFTQLGQLHGFGVEQFLECKNCGKKTVAELVVLLRRAADGEFELSAEEKQTDVQACCRKATQLVDEAMQRIPQRTRQILAWRLGGLSREPLTLEATAAKYRLTRERVRQVVERVLPAIQRAGGPKLPYYLQQIASKCEDALCPLTPELLSSYLGEEVSRRCFPPSFYVRLFGELAPTISVWPSGHDGRGSEEPSDRSMMAALQQVLREKGRALPLQEAYKELWSRGIPQLEPSGFLRALRACGSLRVKFPLAETPEVSLGRLRALDMATAVLLRSDRPLLPEQILEQGKTIFAADLIPRSAHGLCNCLSTGQGFYLLGPRAYGLRKHFQLPEPQWMIAKGDFAEMLAEKNRPVSTPDFMITHAKKWAGKTNAYELAQIIREDDRFTDLGRHLFALTVWGLEERPQIKDLVTKVLKESGRLMSPPDILERLKEFRSLSTSSMPAILRGHPLVRDYGFGHFGLKAWGEKPKSWMVADCALVEKVIRRADPPLQFDRLCEILGIPASGRLAGVLWQTTASLKTVIRKPEEATPTTVLVHRRCSLERALIALARIIGKPLPAYEIQWELNERFANAFGGKTLAEIEKCLERSSMFIRNAEGDFVLDVQLDQMGFDMAEIRRACFDILTQANEIVGCEDLLDRLDHEGKKFEDVSPDILATILREGEDFEEVGRDRFRARACKP